MAVVLRLLPNEEAEARLIDLSDLLPALKGYFSSPLQAVHRFPPSVRVYICHLGGSRGAELPQEPIIPGSKAILTRLISLSHPRPKGRGFQVVTLL